MEWQRKSGWQHNTTKHLCPHQAHHQLSPPKLRIPIPCHTPHNTISPSYTPLPGVMTALALRTSLILVVGFHAVSGCRCTISGAQADSEAPIPGITMTARVDIFTKAVTSNPQTAQPKFSKPNMRVAPSLNRTAFHTTFDNQYGHKKTNTKY